MNRLFARLSALADAAPDAVAIAEDGAMRATRRGLLEAAAGLSGRLVEHGVAPGDRVLLTLPRSADFVVAALAVHRAGAAFVPLDPLHAPARARAIVEQARPRLAIGQPFVGVQTISPGERARPGPALEPEVAYVIFTSGSTGRPKGVVVGSAGLLPMLDAQIAAFGIGPESRVGWLLSPMFDASLSDVGTALLGGAVLSILTGASLGPRRLLARLGGLGITHVDLPPAVLARLDPAALPTTLEAIVTGGEVVPAAVLARLAAGRRVIVSYGPTEATVSTSLVAVHPGLVEGEIGTPLGGVRYALDDGAGPVERPPPGVRGELWIGGEQVARGYLDEPALTQARFVTRDGTRWFRTGDEVLALGDERYRFCGRRDRQRKVRGVLVAPEEIEAALLAQPGVVEARVEVEGERITAVVAGEPAAIGPEAALRRALYAHLPPALVPARIEVARALPRPGPAAKPGPLEPPTPAALAIALAMAKVLGRAEVGVDDDFGELGGDSIAVLDLVAELGEPTLTPLEVERSRTARALALATPELEVLPIAASDRRPAASPGPRPIEHALVTGATGRIGRALVAALLARPGVRVTTWGRASNSPSERSEGGEWPPRTAVSAVPKTSREDPRLRQIFGDLAGLDPVDVGAFGRPTHLFHLAADVRPTSPFSRLAPVNVGGTEAAFRVAAATGARFVLASSLAAPLSSSLAEGAIAERPLPSGLEVLGGYAATKALAERTLEGPGGAAAGVIARLGLVRRPGVAADLGALAGLGGVERLPAEADALAIFALPIDVAVAALLELAEVAPDGHYHLAPAEGTPLAAVRAELAGAPVDAREVARARAALAAGRAPSAEVYARSFGAAAPRAARIETAAARRWAPSLLRVDGPPRGAPR